MSQQFHSPGGVVDVLESDLTHPTHADGFVDAGDPVIFGAATEVTPGFARISATAATDIIPVNTKDNHRATVDGQDNVGAAAVAFGDYLYWDAAGNQLNVDSVNGERFGIALGTVASGGTTEIPVMPLGA